VLFRENGKLINAYNVAYFTASCDTEKTNKRFAESIKLDYPILSDPTRKSALAYGVVTGDGVHPKRWTYYIGKDGKILAIDKSVKAGTHGTQVVKKLAELKIDEAKQAPKAKQKVKSEAISFAGPMVGHVTEHSAAIWMYAPTNSKCIVSYSLESKKIFGNGTPFMFIQDLAVKGPNAPMTAVLAGLTPDTSYHYVISIDGKPNPALEGRFKTAPATGKSSAFRLVVTSCMRVDRPQTSWPLLLAQKPDLHLTLGDTHYADTTNPKVQWKHHLRYRQVPQFAEVLRKVPTYSIWDDHDYGPNNSDGTAKGKEQSLLGWNQFWANPKAGTQETPGAFYTFTRGDVQFFVVDGRYHRSPDKDADDDKKRMLGDAQARWLINGLKSSTAKFKVIASGSTLRHSKVDGWAIYTFSRNRLFDAIKTNRIGGVIYTSGDIHRSHVAIDPDSKRVGYPLIEVVSSGVANSKSLSFATVDFDTTLEDPILRVRIVHGDGTVKNEKSWKLSELQVK
jgi:alkaline phosphatase D